MTEDVPGYRVLEKVGEGGFSVVYRAYQERLDRPVALKVLSISAVDDAAMKRFQRECKITGRLTGHPNIVTVLDTGTTRSNRPYIAMEYFEHGALTDRLAREGPLPVPEVLRIGVKMAGALAATHETDVLHRDVKPQNILVSRYGEPALADFGIARLVDSFDATHTQAFTPHHAAPEVLEGRPPGVPADIYALGSTLYQLLAGTPAFKGPNGEGIAQLMLRILSEPPPEIRRADLPRPVFDAICVAMAKGEDQRFPGAMAFAEGFQRLQRDLGLPVTEVAHSGATQLAPLPEAPQPARSGTVPLGDSKGGSPFAPSGNGTAEGGVSPWAPAGFPGPAVLPSASAVQAPSAPAPARPGPTWADPGQQRPAAAERPAPAWQGPQVGPEPVPAEAYAPPPPLPAPPVAAPPVAAPPVAAPPPQMAAPAPQRATGEHPVPTATTAFTPAAQRPAGGSRRGVLVAGGVALAGGLVLGVIGLLNFGGSDEPAGKRAAKSGPSAPAEEKSPEASSGAGDQQFSPAQIRAAAPRRVRVSFDGGRLVNLAWQLPPTSRKLPIIIQSAPRARNPLVAAGTGAVTGGVSGLNPKTGYCFKVGAMLRPGTTADPKATVAWSRPLGIRGARISG